MPEQRLALAVELASLWGETVLDADNGSPSGEMLQQASRVTPILVAPRLASSPIPFSLGTSTESDSLSHCAHNGADPTQAVALTGSSTQLEQELRSAQVLEWQPQSAREDLVRLQAETRVPLRPHSSDTSSREEQPFPQTPDLLGESSGQCASQTGMEPSTPPPSPPSASPLRGENTPTLSIPPMYSDSVPLRAVPSQWTIDVVTRALAHLRSNPLVRYDRIDPMKVLSPTRHLRSFVVAFPSADVSAMGGTQVLQEILIAWDIAGHWEMSPATFQNKGFTKVVCSSIAAASQIFYTALLRFSRAWCAGPVADGWCLTQNPPLPTLWKGGVDQGGFWPEELPGLVVWELPLSMERALAWVLQKLLIRLKCRQEDLPLFMDPQLTYSSRTQIAGNVVTRVKAFAHCSIVAHIISHGSEGMIDYEITAASFSAGCDICLEKGHSMWSCPKPKLRVRVERPFNLTFRTHIRSSLAHLPDKGGLLSLWGGRSPRRRAQSKKFGYLAFASVEHRDQAERFLSSSLVGSQCFLLPLIKVDSALLSECPSCGCSADEPSNYRLRLHPLNLQACPNSTRVAHLSFGVDLSAPNWRTQISEVPVPSAKQGGRR